MQTEKNPVIKLHGLKEGKTLNDLLYAIKASDLINDGPVECMYQTATAAFKLLSTNDEIDIEIRSALYPLERLFLFYYELATEFTNGRDKENV